MAGTKIRVGVANESLTPSEQHKIEVKVDEMLAVPGVPAVTSDALFENDSKAADAAPVKDKPEVVKIEPKDDAEEQAGAPVIEAEAPAAEATPIEPEAPISQAVKVTEEATEGEAITVSRKPKTASTPEVAQPVEAELPEVNDEAEIPADAGEEVTPTNPVVPQLVKMPWRQPVAATTTEDEAEILPDETPETDDVTIGNLDAVPESHVLDELVSGTKSSSGPRRSMSDVVAAPIPIKRTPSVLEEDTVADKLDDAKNSGDNWIKRLAKAWWWNRWWRYGSFVALLLLLVGIFVAPPGRAMAFNLFGIRANATLTVLDGTTQLPLEGVRVSIGSQQASTNGSGQASLQHVRLGKQTVTVEKPAFGVSRTAQTISLGNNKLAAVTLKPDGTLYKFSITDYVTGKAISKAKAADGDANAIADSRGIIVLTLKAPSAGFSATISAPGYRNETVKVDASKTSTVAVSMAPDVKDVYVSNRDGKYSLYSIDVDAKNDKLLLAGTGNETADISVAQNAAGDEAALVSTRDEQRDSGGYLLQALTLVNVRTKAAVTIDHSQRIELIDWFGDRVVYMMTKAGASAGNPSRYQLMSYNFKTAQRLQLDHANYFNDVVSANGSIYYATSNQYSGGVSQFDKINADASGKQTLLVNEVWDIFRTAHDKFALSSPTGWYDYALDSDKPTSTTSTYSGNGLSYYDGPDGKSSVWLDTRDGKNALLLHDSAAQRDTIIVTRNGITGPVHWINKDSVVFRVSSSSETADYVVSVRGGSPKKITELVNAHGIERYRN